MFCGRGCRFCSVPLKAKLGLVNRVTKRQRTFKRRKKSSNFESKFVNEEKNVSFLFLTPVRVVRLWNVVSAEQRDGDIPGKMALS